MKKLLLIDGHSILNRAFYGIPDLTNKEGFHTNAIYGFLTILFKTMEEENPTNIAVAFDVSAKTFRHEMYKEYKGTRKQMPVELREQIPVMKDVLKAMDILTMEKPSFEADDILGTMANRAEKLGYEVTVLSGDRDLLQVATDHIKVKIPKTYGGKTTVENYYAKDVLNKYQVSPKEFINLKALMGDTSDNVPGVPKVGEKTATQLIVDYHNLDALYENLDKISKKSIKESLSENKELAYLSLKLVTIDLDADISFKVEDTQIDNIFTKEAYQIYENLNFKNLLTKFSKEEKEERVTSYKLYNTNEQINDFVNSIKEQNVVSLLLQQQDEQLLSIVCSINEADPIIFVSSDVMNTDDLQQYLLDIILKCQDLDCTIVTFDSKKIYSCLNNKLKFANSSEANLFFDCKLAAYLIDPNHKEFQIEDLSYLYEGKTQSDFKTLFGKEKCSVLIKEENQEYFNYIACLLGSLNYAFLELKEQLNSFGMMKLFQTVETPLTYVLYCMESNGVLVDENTLDVMNEELSVKIDKLERNIYDVVGEEFNINSPKQLGTILFEKLGFKGGKKTKSGYSTAADVLEKLAEDNQVVADILEYRGLTKLKSTYTVGLKTYIQSDQKIHTSYQQMVTATGRLSSTEPNLQNIPMRSELGRNIRKAFIAPEGYVLLDADYSQVELRILAHMSDDKDLIDAYLSGNDIHQITASKVFHIPMDEVTSIQRRNAKAVNFGIVYGISSFGLSEDLNISKAEAKEYIEKYFETYPQIKKYLDSVVSDAKNNGYTTTMFDRRRPIPELSSSNFMQRQFGERAAMNAPIQGSAADIMKIAMLHVFDKLKESGLQSKLILQVHDELIVEAKIDEIDQVKELLISEMEKAVDLSVPLSVEANYGKNWYEAH